MGKRIKVLGKRRTTVIVTLAVLLLATAVVIGSGASFTSQSTNPANTFSAAGFRIWNQHDGTAVFNVTKMKPDDTSTQSWWVELQGDADGAIAVTVDNIVPVASPNGGNLADRLNVKITDTATTAVVYDGPLTTVTRNIGTWTPVTNHIFQVDVHWTDGTPAQDNPCRGSSCTFDITWDATQV
jgi:spore coat-associated protein N